MSNQFTPHTQDPLINNKITAMSFDKFKSDTERKSRFNIMARPFTMNFTFLRKHIKNIEDMAFCYKNILLKGCLLCEIRRRLETAAFD